MSDIIAPIVIQGPAYVKHGGVWLYTKENVTVEQIDETWAPMTALGPAGKRLKSRSFKISFTPVGMITATLINYMFAAHLSPQTKIGRSIMNGGIGIYSIPDKKLHSYVRAGISSPPKSLFLKPTSTLFGPMEYLAIGAAATQPTDDAFFKTIATYMADDTSYDESKIISDIYSAALGDADSPYDAMGGMDGFQIDFDYQIKPVPASDVGIADAFIVGLGIGVGFVPSNLADADIDTLLNLQGDDALLPGQAYGKGVISGDMVITGTQSGFEFTAKTQGGQSTSAVFQIGTHRMKGVKMVHEITTTTGVWNPLFAISGIT